MRKGPRDRPDWCRQLPRPLIIPKVLTPATLADVRELMWHLPEDRRGRSTWRHVADQLAKAAGGATEPAHVAIALRLLLSMEGVECRAE